MDQVLHTDIILEDVETWYFVMLVYLKQAAHYNYHSFHYDSLEKT